MVDKKWLVRGGALLVLLGFIMPTMTVSCGGVAELGRTVSLYELAALTNATLLYFVPVGALAVVILAFLPPLDLKGNLYVYWGQVAGTVAGVLSMLITLASLRSQFGQAGFELSPEIGGLVLAVGYVLIAAGLVMEWPEVMANQRGLYGIEGVYRQQPAQDWSPPAWSPPPPSVGETLPPFPDEPRSYPRDTLPPTPSSMQLRGNLHLLDGDLPLSIITLDHDDFTIGRGSGNDLILEDRTVSRQHARLRYAQGIWFIQDQQSTAGIYVNEQKVTAKRLQSGDEITIGNYIFEFRD